MLGSFKIPCLWQSTKLAAIKEDVTRRMGEAMLSGGPEARLETALTEIVNLEGASDAVSQQRRFVLIVAALAHHARWGGLNRTQAVQLGQIGEALLKTNGVDPVTSTLSHLWGELRLANSQILRKDGDHWNAAWEQHYSYYLSKRSPVGNKAFHALAIATRSLRLGHLDMALEAFGQAERGQITPRNVELARLGRIQCSRLSLRLDEAKELTQDMTGWASLSDTARRELEWEEACLAAQESGSLDQIVRMVDKGGSHRTGTYLLEAFLWSRAVPSRRYEERVPRVANMRRFAAEDIKSSDAMQAFYECCLALERAYESERPLSTRLEALGKALERSAVMPSVDKELLLLAGAVRWLMRHKQANFAALVVAEYRSRSLALTGGRSRDALNLLVNLDDGRILAAMLDGKSSGEEDGEW